MKKIIIKEKTKAWAIVVWLMLSVLGVMCTAENIGIPLAVSVISLILSACASIYYADIIDKYIEMID